MNVHTCFSLCFRRFAQFKKIIINCSDEKKNNENENKNRNVVSRKTKHTKNIYSTPKDSEIDSRSSAWRWESIVVAVQITTSRPIATAVVRIALQLASEVPHLNAFHASPLASMRKSKFPFRIHQPRTFPVRHTAMELISFMQSIIASMAGRLRHLICVAAIQRQVAAAAGASRATTIPLWARTFWASASEHLRRAQARKWERETLKLKLKSFAWKQKVGNKYKQQHLLGNLYIAISTEYFSVSLSLSLSSPTFSLVLTSP